MDDEAVYYSSHNKLPFIARGGLDQLARQKVLVIGAGGLGCPCLLALAGAGIGTIGIADFDTIAVSNLHRQPLYNFNDTGKLKTTAAAARLGQYNPFIHIHTHHLLVNETNALALIRDYDIVADCTDNFSTRYLINDACIYLNKPLVYGAIHQAEGHVTVFNYQNSATLRCLFPKDENGSIASCAEIGAYNITTTAIGNLMAGEVIKISLQLPGVLAGKLNQLDLISGSSVIIHYQHTAEERKRSMERFEKVSSSPEITPATFTERMQQGNIFLLDVREPEEHRAAAIGGINIPLAALLQTQQLPFIVDDEIIVYCQKGNRSRQAVAHLLANGFYKAVSLQGGLDLYNQISSAQF